MRSLVLNSCFVLCSFLSFGQFQVFSGPSPSTIKKVYFVYRGGDLPKLDSLKLAISKAWKHREITFVSFDEYKAHVKEAGDLIFSIDADISIVGSSHTTNGDVVYTSAHNVYYYLRAHYYQTTATPSVVASTDLFVDKSIRKDLAKKDYNFENSLPYVYGEGKIFNWNYAFLSSFLGFYSNYLMNHNTVVQSNNSNLKNLQTEKLYISDNINKKVTKSANIVGRDQSERIKSKYQYNYEVVSNSTLDSLACSENRGYVLFIIRERITRRIIVVDMKTYEVLYNVKGEYKKYDFHLDDMKLLNKVIQELK